MPAIHFSAVLGPSKQSSRMHRPPAGAKVAGPPICDPFTDETGACRTPPASARQRRTIKEIPQMTTFAPPCDFLGALAASGACLATSALAQEGGLKEPVFRVSKGNTNGQVGAMSEHPLDPAIDLANDSLAHFQQNVADYTCRIVSRERVNGVVGTYDYMDAKIRNQKVEGGRVVTPLSVYLKFAKPEAAAGREIMWIQGQNNEKMLVNPSDGDGRFLPSVWLKPDGPIAMRGRLHPLTFIGIENLIIKLIERGERERKFQECEVRFIKDAKINGRVCTVLEVEHPGPAGAF